MNNTIVIKITNNTKFVFVINKIEVNNPGNYLTTDKTILIPGGSINITGTTDNTDLFGTIYFNDNSTFNILVPLQFHYRQPIFKIDAEYVFSTIESREYNPHIEARLLTYVKADVSLKNMFKLVK